MSIKEGQDNVVLLTFEHGQCSGYSAAVSLSERDTWVTVERERRDRVTLRPRQVKWLVALVSGGDFASAGAALKELRVTGNQFNAGTTSLGFHSAVALANQSIESLKATSAAMGSIFFVEVMGAGSGHLALTCAYQARAEGVLVNEYPAPDAYIDQMILGTLKQTLGVPNKSHLFIVAERTPHRHHRDGGVHGLVDYVAHTVGHWPQFQPRPDHYPLSLATKATILGHTLRGGLPTPEDKAIAQHLAYEAVRRLVSQPENVVGCMLAYRESAPVEAIPLHAVAHKPFDWEIFTRMHGSDLSDGADRGGLGA